MKQEPQPQNTKRDEARASLPEEARPIFDQLTNDYRFAATKHHGAPFVSYVVLAELVRMGWRCSEAVIEGNPPRSAGGERTQRGG